MKFLLLSEANSPYADLLELKVSIMALTKQCNALKWWIFTVLRIFGLAYTSLVDNTATLLQKGVRIACIES